MVNGNPCIPDRARCERVIDRLTRPALPLWDGVLAFPWYATSLRAWIYLSLLGLIVFGLMLIQLLFWPFG